MIKYNKTDITTAVYNQILDPRQYYPDAVTVDDLVFKWWTTNRSGSGLQLSYIGMLAFQYADIHFYEFDVNLLKSTESVHSFLIKLNKRMPCPFYIFWEKSNLAAIPKIKIYDNKVAMLINLYGTVYEYVNSIQEYYS